MLLLKVGCCCCCFHTAAGYFRTKLQELRDKFGSAQVVPDYVDIAAQAKIICARARAGAQRKALEQQVCA